MWLHQRHYVDKLLEKFNMTQTKPTATSLAVGAILTQNMCPKTDAELQEMRDVPFRMLVGCLLWLSNWTRPVISYATSIVLQFLANPGTQH